MNCIKEDIINKIDNLITIRAENTWLNQFKYIIKYSFNSNKENIVGQTNSDSFILWQYNSFWGGIFYPIIYGYFCKEADQTVLKLKTKLNIIGKLSSIILFIVILCSNYSSCYTYADGKILLDPFGILLTVIISFLFQTVPFFAYKMTKKSSIDFIKEYLKNEKRVVLAATRKQGFRAS
jgi:hypothetical protein